MAGRRGEEGKAGADVSETRITKFFSSTGIKICAFDKKIKGGLFALHSSIRYQLVSKVSE